MAFVSHLPQLATSAMMGLPARCLARACGGRTRAVAPRGWRPPRQRVERRVRGHADTIRTALGPFIDSWDDFGPIWEAARWMRPSPRGRAVARGAYENRDDQHKSEVQGQAQSGMLTRGPNERSSRRSKGPGNRAGRRVRLHPLGQSAPVHLIRHGEAGAGDTVYGYFQANLSLATAGDRAGSSGLRYADMEHNPRTFPAELFLLGMADKETTEEGKTSSPTSR